MKEQLVVEQEPIVLASVACNLDVDILSAVYPLLEAGRVEAIEWSFDALYGIEQVPDWFSELLRTYGNGKRLVGHGVFFSLFSAKWSVGQQHWLEQLKQLSSYYHFDHVTEHFGFFTGQNFHYGAPLTIPFTSTTLAIGRDRLMRIYDACRCPVGLENLAFSYSLDEVKQHGEFLDKLLSPVNGFIILDLHNLYCQLHNFSLLFEDLIDLYPLERVREIHISGGSWEASELVPKKTIRRDTHDDAVPAEVFQLLERTMPLCPNLRYVVLEQLGYGLKTESSKASFRSDFLKMEQLVQSRNKEQPSDPTKLFLPLHPVLAGPVLEDEELHGQQVLLSHILETAPTYAAAMQMLQSSSLAHTDWKIEHWEPHMLETAVSIAQKWKKQS